MSVCAAIKRKSYIQWDQGIMYTMSVFCVSACVAVFSHLCKLPDFYPLDSSISGSDAEVESEETLEED